MTSVRERWSRAWFAPADARHLALCRIAWCAFFLLHLASSGLDARIDSFDPASAQMEALPLLSLLAWPMGGAAALDADLLRTILRVTQVAGLLAIVGLGTRVALPVFAFGGVLLQSFAYSFGRFGHDVSLLVWAIVLLCFVPCATVLGVDALLARGAGRGRPAEPLPGAAWPLRTVHVLLALAYLSAGTSKLARDPGAWFGGDTLQYYVSFFALRSQSEAGLWLVRHHELVTVGAWLLVLFETSFILSVWLRRFAAVWLVGSLVIHACAFVFMGVKFFSFPLLCLTVLPWRRSAADARALFASWSPHRALRSLRFAASPEVAAVELAPTVPSKE